MKMHEKLTVLTLLLIVLVLGGRGLAQTGQQFVAPDPGIPRPDNLIQADTPTPTPVATPEASPRETPATRSPQRTRPTRPATERPSIKRRQPVSRNPSSAPREPSMDEKAWQAYDAGDYSAAAALFKKLHRARPTPNRADGWYYSLYNAQRDGELLALLRADEPYFRERVAEGFETDLQRRGLLQNAAILEEPEKVYLNVETANLTGQIGYRRKGGEDGLSALQSTELPTFHFAYPVSPIDTIFLEVGRLSLDAGAPGFFEPIGTAPVAPSFYLFEPTSQYANMVNVKVGWAHEDWTSYYVEVGTTPLGADLGPLPVGRAGVIQQTRNGFLQLEVFAQSEKESILSYAGLRDPYQGGYWGRVVETGGQVSLLQLVYEDYTASGTAGAAALVGDGVKTNFHAFAEMGITYDFKLSGFEYFAVGPLFTFDHYSENLGAFTRGHGGYYSPTYLFQQMVGLYFLTEEGKDWLVRGDFVLGAQQSRQASAPVFPLAPDGRTIPGSSSITVVGGAEVSGVWQFHPHWQVGAAAGFRATASYEEFSGVGFLQYNFEPRNAVFRSDLARPFDF